MVPVEDEVNDELRCITAYHEAGHARAAARRAGRVDGIDISFAPFRSRGWNAVDISELADIAFYAYAGSWAQTWVQEPEACNDLDKLWMLVRENSDDWGELQRGLGRDVSDEEIFGAGIYGMEKRDGAPPGEIRPDRATVLRMHEDLDDERSNIEQLAQQMLDGADEITVGVGPPLVKVSESRWLRPGYAPPNYLNGF